MSVFSALFSGFEQATSELSVPKVNFNEKKIDTKQIETVLQNVFEGCFTERTTDLIVYTISGK